MRRDFLMMFLVLVVGVLTGFVVNSQQPPTRWEFEARRFSGHLNFTLEASERGALGWELVTCQSHPSTGVTFCYFKRPVQ